MLLSFNKCSISALTEPIYQSVKKNAVGENYNFSSQLRSQMQCVCHRPFIGLYVCTT